MNGSTICREGCAMSSVSMALNCFGIKIPTSSGMLTDSNPDTLNTWLQEHQGYVCLGGDCNNLVLNAPDRIPTPPHVVKYAEPYKLISKEEMRQHIDRKGIVIAHVRNSGHFVLLTGYETESDIFYCNDPFFSVTYYTYQEMSSQLLYYMA
ncbi:hypothetical protein M0813_28739 [Anaeramoeba flamelloides]|nr:hypothetical protein M0813_28739 [Anaeramoeba flamelloides]